MNKILWYTLGSMADVVGLVGQRLDDLSVTMSGWVERRFRW